MGKVKYTDEEIERKRAKYPWWKNDSEYPVPISVCGKCKYRDYRDNGLCNYQGVTHQLRPVGSTLPEAPYCVCFEKGDKIASGKGIVVKRYRRSKDGE